MQCSCRYFYALAWHGPWAWGWWTFYLSSAVYFLIMFSLDSNRISFSSIFRFGNSQKLKGSYPKGRLDSFGHRAEIGNHFVLDCDNKPFKLQSDWKSIRRGAEFINYNLVLAKIYAQETKSWILFEQRTSEVRVPFCTPTRPDPFSRNYVRYRKPRRPALWMKINLYILNVNWNFPMWLTYDLKFLEYVKFKSKRMSTTMLLLKKSCRIYNQHMCRIYTSMKLNSCAFY